jgi:hypothetical protein
VVRRRWGTVFAAFLILFLAEETWGTLLLMDPAAQLRQADLITALLGLGLLVVDAALPVPSSPVTRISTTTRRGRSRHCANSLHREFLPIYK